MVFNSFTFLLFFNIFFIVYWNIGKRLSLTWTNAWILLGSYAFYGWWDWRFLSLIVISSLSDFLIGQKIHQLEAQKKRKLWLSLSIFINLGILGFFKYYNFFIDSLASSLGYLSIPTSLQTLEIILPVGISFYTFQTLSYTVDIYNRKLEPTKNILAFFSFVAFFPQLVAGPIERAKDLLPQFFTKKEFDLSNISGGSRLVLWGLFKKIVIADNLGIIVNQIFAPDASVMTAFLTLIGSICFAIQIYCDFSGYTDIAIGIAKMLGFELKPNFKTPYLSASLTEFWRRWHISLSTWFRDYIYIPLGGSRKNNLRTNWNIFITFLLSGLWHGANITFVIWGILHGLVLIIEKTIKIKTIRWLAVLFTFLLVVLFWIPFRAENFEHLMALVGSLGNVSNFNWEAVNPFIFVYSDYKMIGLGTILLFFGIMDYKINQSDFNVWIQQFSTFKRTAIYYGLVAAILLLGNFSVKPDFIYFQF
jgi:D-alanyl-lipoteichoic acid acyltransferase DltB (MBOAT superfamily)